MIRRFVQRVRAVLALPEVIREQHRTIQRLLEESAKGASRPTDESRLAREIAALKADVAAMRKDLDSRLLQYHLQLGRLTRLLSGDEEIAMTGERVPVRVEPRASSTPSIEALSPARPDQWMHVDACPACNESARTVVCEWNKLALLETVLDERSWTYNYAVCHGCGILYATERPVGARYAYLLEHFEDVIDKNATNPLLNPHPLTDEDRARYRALMAKGVFVSDHEGGEYLGGVFRDRLENAHHVDVLGALLDLRGARVLEIRSRAGTIVEGLRRLYGANVSAMPLWPAQQLILRELYGIPTSDVIDFDRFSIPFDGSFDLIAANHMFNHAVRLGEFLRVVRAALKPGGHLYLYNEIDDREFLDAAQSMIATMNPLHLQAADRASMMRALAASGFETVFIKTRDRRNLCLARAVDGPRRTPMTPHERDKRLAKYQRARDRAVLRAPERVRHRFAATWPSTVERAVASGVAVFDESGAIRVVRP